LIHQTRKVLDHADRGHLQELNSFSEEVDIINNVMRQQCDVLNDFRYTLSPQSFQAPSPFRQMHFEHESRFIDKLLRSIERQIQDCNELRDRVSRLTSENVQLVETWQDENSNSIFIFTIVTIIFLPLSFVTGFFGMNLQGISGTTKKTIHFWEVAVPLTVGIALVCAGVVWRNRLRFMKKIKRR
jgi:Mg2+ and Co2+ transporter CorA